jgi:hypothetical protein
MKVFLSAMFLVFSYSLNAQDAFFNISMGPDFVVKNPSDASALEGTRFRLELELGGKNLGFTFQPAFGGGASTIYMGPRFMLPFQIGSQPLFIVPDITVGPDFGFGNGQVSLAMDIKTGVRLFYELQEGMGISFRPFGFALRTFNIRFGEEPNQSQLSVRYEMLFGFTYFF